MPKVSIQTQISTIDTIISHLANGGSSTMRPAERELLANRAKSVRETLLFCELHIAEIKEFMATKKAGK